MPDEPANNDEERADDPLHKTEGSELPMPKRRSPSICKDENGFLGKVVSIRSTNRLIKGTHCALKRPFHGAEKIDQQR